MLAGNRLQGLEKVNRHTSRLFLHSLLLVLRRSSLPFMRTKPTRYRQNSPISDLNDAQSAVRISPPIFFMAGLHVSFSVRFSSSTFHTTARSSSLLAFRTPSLSLSRARSGTPSLARIAFAQFLFYIVSISTLLHVSRSSFLEAYPRFLSLLKSALFLSRSL